MEIQNQNRKFHLKKLRQIKEQKQIYFFEYNQYTLARADTCLYSILGNQINIYWDKLNANMVIQKSQADNFTHIFQEDLEIFQKVEFRHAFQCPLLSKNIQGTSEKHYKPCACVMLQHENHFLITRRGLNLATFKGAWVLPGGHLQKNESIIQGGLRECEEQVGLSNQIVSANLQKGVMAWESVYIKDLKVRSCGLVIFFNAKVSQQFEVIPHQHEVQQFKWKQITNQDEEHRYNSQNKNGYGQAHLNYLSYFRKKNYLIQEKKSWEESYKSTH